MLQGTIKTQQLFWRVLFRFSFSLTQLFWVLSLLGVKLKRSSKYLLSKIHVFSCSNGHQNLLKEKSLKLKLILLHFPNFKAFFCETITGSGQGVLRTVEMQLQSSCWIVKSSREDRKVAGSKLRNIKGYLVLVSLRFVVSNEGRIKSVPLL